MSNCLPWKCAIICFFFYLNLRKRCLSAVFFKEKIFKLRSEAFWYQKKKIRLKFNILHADDAKDTWSARNKSAFKCFEHRFITFLHLQKKSVSNTNYKCWPHTYNLWNEKNKIKTTDHWLNNTSIEWTRIQLEFPFPLQILGLSGEY